MYAMKQSEVANRRAAGEKFLDPITATMAVQWSGDGLEQKSRRREL